MPNIIEINDVVTMLDYSISRKTLLLRVHKTDEDGNHSNIDITFNSVRYFELETTLENIVLKEGTEEDKAYLESKISFHPITPVEQPYVIESKGKKYYVLCLNVKITENSLSFYETSISSWAP